MSYRKISGAVAAIIAALVLTGGAYGDPGKNGPPGPEGNPNQPAAQPQANGPQGPAGNDQQGQSGSSQGQSDSGKSGQSHGKSDQSHGKSGASHGNSGATTHGNSGQSHGNSGSHANHANPSPGTPRKGGREDRPAGKITICHATKSVKNPYVEITISVNGLHGHGPADDPHHHAGSWKDIIPAPAGGCPGTVQPQSGTGGEKEHPGKITICHATGSATNPFVEITISVNGLNGHDDHQDGRDIIPAPAGGCPGTTTESTTAGPVVVPAPEVAVKAPATATAPAPATAPEAPAAGNQAVLGERASGGTSPSAAPGQSEVLGASASGTNPPPAAQATHAANASNGSLPFTGFELAFALIVAAAALIGGFALRRVTSNGRRI